LGLGSTVIWAADCSDGTGYGFVTERSLRNQGFTVNLTLLGIPTATIGPDFQIDPRFYPSSTYSTDGFHLSDAGGALISSLIVQAITSSSFPTPPARCAEMALVS
jgi:hypothetical protein